MITVVVPVGPRDYYVEYAKEAVQSLREQTVAPDEILLVDDMADLNPIDFPNTTIYRTPWNLGVPGAANCGVALARNEHIFFLACDDKLKPNAVENIINTYKATNDPLGYYWVDIEYSTGETQSLPCGHALISKALWRKTGGFPPQSAVGACDHIFVNMLQIHHVCHFYHVTGGPIYWHREHAGQDTHNRCVDYGVIESVRDSYAKVWKEPSWQRYVP